MLSDELTHCQYCQSPVENKYAFCPNCGSALKSAETTPDIYYEITASQLTAPGDFLSSQQPTQQAITAGREQPQQQLPAKKQDKYGLASMILGIIGLFILPVVASIPAIVLGHISYKRSKNKMAKKGLIAGYIPVGLGVLLASISLFLYISTHWF
ncbi:MAG: DUF4190 domain-containing protein [Candidatus Heimdallarchaeota archaeon]|nr:DUF4190 domain-containing protein [Candidatus Heimdallarchaeota archaeon]